jgi:Fe-S-cluster containining protein
MVMAQMPNKRQSDFFGVCIQCKRPLCCEGTRPPITSERRKIIEAYLKEQKFPVENMFVAESYTFPREDAEGYCIFHDKKTRKCKIHSVKPETCVAGPITFDINKKTQKIEWHLKKEEICLLAGRMGKDNEALRKHLESARKELLQLVQQLDPKALQAILRIEEPETFKIEEDSLDKSVLDKLAAIP